ncbi:MAG: hypothetical protein KY464_14695 [Gemmatimonadetes bacterium]|nr:hypothetical protein [Gemmatimonadota bacterium]
MDRFRRTVVALALLGALSACQGESEPAAGGPGEPTTAPDRPAPAFTDPGSPSPVGTDVGAVERDTSAGSVANDSMAVPGR